MDILLLFALPLHTGKMPQNMFDPPCLDVYVSDGIVVNIPKHNTGAVL
jgi:hypothetical protein